MANDLGTQRKLTDRLLDLKREEDLSNNTPEPVQLDGADLLDDPMKALDRYSDAREARLLEKTQERLTQLESQLQSDRFMQKHPDFMELGQDPKFLEWVQSSPLRASAGQAAAAGDWDAADALLTEYKATAPAPSEVPPQDDAVAEARKVALEGSNTSGDTNTGKVYRRADLIDLKLNKPHVYSDPAFQQEILKAYAEGI